MKFPVSILVHTGFTYVTCCGLGDMVMPQDKRDMQVLRISTYDLMDALFIHNIASDPPSQASAKPLNTRKLR